MPVLFFLASFRGPQLGRSPVFLCSRQLGHRAPPVWTNSAEKFFPFYFAIFSENGFNGGKRLPVDGLLSGLSRQWSPLIRWYRRNRSL